MKEDESYRNKSVTKINVAMNFESMSRDELLVLIKILVTAFPGSLNH